MGRHNDHSIKEVFRFLEDSNSRIKKGLQNIDVQEVWHAQMGSTISGYTQKISFYEGALKVYLTSAPLKKELMTGREKIRKLLNDALGSEVIQTVEIL